MYTLRRPTDRQTFGRSLTCRYCGCSDGHDLKTSGNQTYHEVCRRLINDHVLPNKVPWLKIDVLSEKLALFKKLEAQAQADFLREAYRNLRFTKLFKETNWLIYGKAKDAEARLDFYRRSTANT